MTGIRTLALDATAAAHPVRTGIGIYSEKLIEALARSVPPNTRAELRLVLACRPGPYVRWSWRRRWTAGFRVRPLLDPWLLWPRARLFHGLAQRLPEKPYPAQVVTLHERFPPPPDAYSTEAFRRFMSRRIEHAIRHADRIIAVSESVRRQLVQHDPSLNARVHVIHHGVDHPTTVDKSDIEHLLNCNLKLNPSQRFFLNVGSVQTRKNISGIVLALKPLPEFSLVLAGEDGYGANEIRALVRREGMADRVRFLGHVGPEILRLLYASATALVFPSFEEAFGLPILEAMSHGLPVITSNVSAMPEVAGDAAILVDPHSVAAIREAMRRVAEDASLVSELRRKGRARAAMFSWDRCAQQTWAIYEELLREAQ